MCIRDSYDNVAEISDEERTKFSEVPFDEDAYRTRVGVPALFGEPEYSLIERMWARPTLDANGIWGGFQGEGVKTIIPAKAGCKITCRLVPDQDPDQICNALDNHIKKHTPKGVGAVSYTHLEFHLFKSENPPVTALSKGLLVFGLSLIHI